MRVSQRRGECGLPGPLCLTTVRLRKSTLLVRTAMVAVASLLGLIVPAFSVGRALGGQSSAIYSQLRTFSLASDSATVENLTLQRDRVVITFVQGIFYFAVPVAGKVRGAVFVGTGNFHSDVPPDEAERANVRRLLKADDISSDFKTAVFQFTDDTYDFIGKSAKPGAAAPPQAQRLATELLKSLLEEEGLNLASRTMESILDGENPGSSSRSSTVENDSAFPSCLIRRLACLLPISKSMQVKRASSLHTIPTFTQATSGSPSFPRLTTNLAGPHIQTCSIWWTRRNTNWNWTCANRRRP